MTNRTPRERKRDRERGATGDCMTKLVILKEHIQSVIRSAEKL